MVPSGGLSLGSGRWKAKRHYLFNRQNLARVFRAKLLQRLRTLGLSAPAETPEDWVVHCVCVGDGEQALAYFARYLYRGVLSEADMLGIEGDKVRFRYRDAKTGELTRCCAKTADSRCGSGLRPRRGLASKASKRPHLPRLTARCRPPADAGSEPVR